MSEEIYEKFGRLLVEKVRDLSIKSLDSDISGRSSSIDGKYLHSLIKELPDETQNMVSKLIPYLVDSTISAVLEFIDIEEEYDIIVISEDGTKNEFRFITESMSADYSAEVDGWVARYSKQRPNEIYTEIRKLQRQIKVPKPPHIPPKK